MNLYVWRDPYEVSYGASCLYVVANSLEEARELAKRAPVSSFGYDPEKTPDNDWLDLSKREPDRVLPVPCAEIYHWAE